MLQTMKDLVVTIISHGERWRILAKRLMSVSEDEKTNQVTLGVWMFSIR